MAPSILIAGATGNTGRSVVEYLPQLIKNTAFASHRVIALTRSLDNPAAKKFAEFPVEVIEQNWVEIDEAWLRKHEVERVFIASHNEPNQFAEEGQFLVNLLAAGVKYVVRISTVASNVTPNAVTYYPRTHWAIEKMLSEEEFKGLQWTSLQPNLFVGLALTPAVRFIKEFQKTGKQGTLSTALHQHVGQGVIDPYDIGILAAYLLAKDDPTPYAGRLLVSGPEDVDGEDIKKLVEDHIGEPVERVRYQDMSLMDRRIQETSESKNVVGSVKRALESCWAGEAKASTTSKEVLELYPPKRTVAGALKQLLEA